MAVAGSVSVSMPMSGSESGSGGGGGGAKGAKVAKEAKEAKGGVGVPAAAAASKTVEPSAPLVIIATTAKPKESKKSAPPLPAAPSPPPADDGWLIANALEPKKGKKKGKTSWSYGGVRELEGSNAEKPKDEVSSFEWGELAK
ncbi:MAG: hypothetical protein M1826_006271 [Phylliscum demangeonii]|nr:MAG: hypothetical protein M1826_006271 [Phylliscum demangeonii]